MSFENIFVTIPLGNGPLYGPWKLQGKMESVGLKEEVAFS